MLFPSRRHKQLLIYLIVTLYSCCCVAVGIAEEPRATQQALEEPRFGSKLLFVVSFGPEDVPVLLWNLQRWRWNVPCSNDAVYVNNVALMFHSAHTLSAVERQAITAQLPNGVVDCFSQVFWTTANNETLTSVGDQNDSQAYLFSHFWHVVRPQHRAYKYAFLMNVLTTPIRPMWADAVYEPVYFSRRDTMWMLGSLDKTLEKTLGVREWRDRAAVSATSVIHLDDPTWHRVIRRCLATRSKGQSWSKALAHSYLQDPVIVQNFLHKILYTDIIFYSTSAKHNFDTVKDIPELQAAHLVHFAAASAMPSSNELPDIQFEASRVADGSFQAAIDRPPVVKAPPSPKLAVVMPFTPGASKQVLWNIGWWAHSDESGATADGSGTGAFPCQMGGYHSSEITLILLLTRKWTGKHSVIRKAIDRRLDIAKVRQCFGGGIQYRSAKLKASEDVFKRDGENGKWNSTGPATMFWSLFDDKPGGIAAEFDYAFWMEPDALPYKTFWLDRLYDECLMWPALSSFWMKGSATRGPHKPSWSLLEATVLNTNAIYNVGNRRFVAYVHTLEQSLGANKTTWFPDCWLMQYRIKLFDSMGKHLWHNFVYTDFIYNYGPAWQYPPMDDLAALPPALDLQNSYIFHGPWSKDLWKHEVVAVPKSSKDADSGSGSGSDVEAHGKGRSTETKTEL